MSLDVKDPLIADPEKYGRDSQLQQLDKAKPRKSPAFTRLLVSTFAIALTLFSGRWFFHQSALRNSLLPPSDDALHDTSSTHDSIPNEEFHMVAAAPWGKEPVLAKPTEDKDRMSWKVTCSSQLDNAHECKSAVNGKSESWWQSASSDKGHWIIVDLGSKRNVHSVAVIQREKDTKDNKVGRRVTRHSIQVAIKDGEWLEVALGTWRGQDDWNQYNYATFEPQEARFVRLQVIETSSNQAVAISDLNVYTVPTIAAPKPGEGRWNITLDFPLVPVTAFLDPINLELTTLASSAPDSYGGHGQTYAATWNIKDNTIKGSIVQDKKPKHDMFCPGTSLDENGKVLITGGVDDRTFTFFDPNAKKWFTPLDGQGKGKEIKQGRGYQGQTYLSNGSSFMIGGTWSGGPGDKNGEIWDPISQEWTVLTKITADLIKMDVVDTPDCITKGIKHGKCTNMREWQQHHAWLFAWKQDSIFHAGPSKAMHWFFYKEPGGRHEEAGLRADDRDAVCGITSMYDAERGAIITAGGAPNYHYWLEADGNRAGEGTDPKTSVHREESRNNAYEIVLGDVQPGKALKTRKLPSMKFQRIFASSVIFPNGETLVVGGQRQGEPFHDDTWQPVPEIYSPETGKWRTVTSHSTPRIYHSWAMLLPDASVLVGGGGLSKFPKSNHYDAQIYQPSYLFKADGRTLADRPVIKATDKVQYRTGEKMKIVSSVDLDSASLIRYSAATHALNNDLRRIKLTLSKAEPVGGDISYTVNIPGNPGVTLPGYWMLFTIKGNVPSIAKTVQILKA